MTLLISIDRIKQNNKDDMKKLCSTIKKILQNILSSPNDIEKRRLSLSSSDVVDNLMPYSGALEFLFEIGFEEEDESFILPLKVGINDLKKYISEVDSLINDEKPATLCSTSVPSKVPSKPQVIKKPVSNNPPRDTSQLQIKLLNSFHHVLIYEDVDLKRKALRLIPVERLKSEANHKYESYKTTLDPVKDTTPYDNNDFVLIELLAWFKNEFFSWTNQPDCSNCNTNEHQKFTSSQRANLDESIWMANNVEVYTCMQCRSSTRFPRYNHPSKLLETRTGRCGEWANCFCLCLRALDFDARYVLDWTDHVWCEVYSKSQKRWLHADPCENALDKPLIYEHGWKKKLSYIIAFSRHECVDVSWRYSTKHNELVSRRNECDENWLAGFMMNLSKSRQTSLTEDHRNELQMRYVSELVEFVTPRIIKEGEDIGRQSGSLQWRLSRGETDAVSSINVKHEFKIKNDSIKDKMFYVKYNTVRDIYVQSNGDKEDIVIKEWKNGASKYSNIQRKVEHDWKMCYLARTQGSSSAFLEWKFNLEDIDAKNLHKICLTFDYKCFENGNIELRLLNNSGESELLLRNNSSGENEDFIYEFKNGCYEFSLKNIKLFGIKATLLNGSGDNAWQHTQLFRQSLNDNNAYLFEVMFNFK